MPLNEELTHQCVTFISVRDYILKTEVTNRKLNDIKLQFSLVMGNIIFIGGKYENCEK